MSGRKSWWGLVLCAFLNIGLAVGQVTTGTVSGIVSDATGALIPGAKVSIKNLDTQVTRTVNTDGAGRYNAPQLAVGNYEVTVEAPGFQTVSRTGIELAVGREAVIKFTMQVGAVAEQITVAEEAPLIEATSSSVSGLVNQTQMRELPLNARSYEQLATLQPNVYYQRNSVGTTNTGYTPRISAAGMRQIYNAYIVDGVDISDTSNQTPGSAAGQLMGVETLREFRVLTNNAPAQYGRAVGAIIDVASRSGGNDLHGSVFEFLRNNALDARSFFDSKNPPFKRNQFGAVVGGPIVKNKFFFFGSYEAFRDRLTTTNIALVPTDLAKQGILPDPTDPTKTRTVNVDPAVKPFLAVYPRPQRDIGGGVGTYSFPFNGSTREDFISVRSDYQRSSNVSYFSRYSWDDTNRLLRYDPTNIPPWAGRLLSRNQTVTVAETRVINPQLINEFRAGFVRYTPRSRIALTGPDPQLQFPGVVGQGIISFTSGTAVAASSVATLGTAGRPFENYTGNTYQVSDNLSYVKGAHSFKMGFNLERFQDNVGNLTESGLYQYMARYNFQSLEQFLVGNAFSFTGVIKPSAVGISGRQLLYGTYLQDEYRLRINLTLNLGIRYEFVSNYSDTRSRFIVLNDLFGTPKTGQKAGYHGRMCGGCVDPRIGFAWDVFSNGKTAVKGGFGVFRAQNARFAAFYNIPTESPGGQNINVTNPSFPNPTIPRTGGVILISNSGTGSSGVTILPRVPSTPSAMQWNLTVDQQLSRDMSLRLGYVGSHGYHLDGGSVINTNTYQILPDGSIFFPPGVHRIRPDFGAVQYEAYDFNSYYNAFEVTLGRRMKRGLGFETSYVFSRNTDDTSSGRNNGNFITSEPRLVDFRRHVHHGRSGLDMRNRFIGNVTYEFPSMHSGGAVISKVLSGWQTNSIITAQAGTPLTPLVSFDRANTVGENPGTAQRTTLSPSLKGSLPTCPCQLAASLGGEQRSPQRYFDPTSFVLPAAGTYGNAGRNIMTGPGLMTVDLALVKNTAIAERLNLQFRAEAYNLFNSVNWAQPNQGIFDTNGSIKGSAGQITSTNTTGRQIQFALKVIF